MSLFADRVANMAAWLAQRAGVATGAAISRAWHSESLAPKAGTVATRPSTLSAARSMGGSALPGDARPKAIMQGSPLPGDARPKSVMQGSALPVDPRPRAIMQGSALPVDARPKAVVAEGSALPLDSRPKSVMQQGSALPVDARPKAIMSGSALPRDVVDEVMKQAGLAKAARARQAKDQGEELQL